MQTKNGPAAQIEHLTVLLGLYGELTGVGRGWHSEGGAKLGGISPTRATHDGELTSAFLGIGEALVWAGGGG
jgi:hypothetical protein